jgi:hypothetical protein
MRSAGTPEVDESGKARGGVLFVGQDRPTSAPDRVYIAIIFTVK